MKQLSRLIIITLILASTISLLIAIGLNKNSDGEHQEEHVSVSAADRQMALRSLIQGYIADGLLLKVEKRGAIPSIYITREFGLLSHNEKVMILGVVLSFFNDSNTAIKRLELYDAQSERAIGDFENGQIVLR